MKNPNIILDMWQADKKKWILIDEIQKRPELLDLVHQSIENKKIKFALTGSSARKLKKALTFGLLPKYWNEKNLSDPDISRSLYSYVNTYLKEEIAAEQLVRNLDPFRKFLMCAAQTDGQIINYAKLERDAGISHSQAERHFEILVDTLIGYYLEPFKISVRKRQSKKSKFYFFDNGVVRTINQLVQQPVIQSTTEYGQLFENFVMNEFFKLKSALEKPWKSSYLRTKDDVEIDLIIEKPRGKIILIDIKSSLKIKPEAANHIMQIKKDLNTEACYVLSNDPVTTEVSGVRFMNYKKGLAEIFSL